MRIFGMLDDNSVPEIDPEEVSRFFGERAEKSRVLGPVRAVIYQDKHPDLAERRNAAEIAALLPMLDLKHGDRILDIGCGTGRWASVVAPSIEQYTGADFSSGLIQVARDTHAEMRNVHFHELPCTQVSLPRLGVDHPFNKILMMGILIYLNDADVRATLSRVVEVAAPTTALLIREPVAIERRLTIKSHYSSELEQVYNAIYRTERELLEIVSEIMGPSGFKVSDSGDVFSDPDLSNRSETKQKWYLIKRYSEE